MTPASMLQRPKKRNWPSSSCNACCIMRRQPPGDRKGNKPSSTSTRASAVQMLPASKDYFFAAGACGPAPRMTLKNSEVDGSSTITSPLRWKLAR